MGITPANNKIKSEEGEEGVKAGDKAGEGAMMAGGGSDSEGEILIRNEGRGQMKGEGRRRNRSGGEGKKEMGGGDSGGEVIGGRWEAVKVGGRNVGAW